MGSEKTITINITTITIIIVVVVVITITITITITTITIIIVVVVVVITITITITVGSVCDSQKPQKSSSKVLSPVGLRRAPWGSLAAPKSSSKVFPPWGSLGPAGAPSQPL